jgi:hypothetical protein
MQQASPGRRRGADDVRHEIQRRMSSAGAHIRRLALARAAAADAWRMCQEFDAQARADAPGDLPAVFRNRDLCLAHAVYLAAIAEYLERGGQSRGSFLVMDESERWRLNPPGTFVDNHILEVSVGPDCTPRTAWVDIRAVPAEDAWFETAWKAYRDGTVFD